MNYAVGQLASKRRIALLALASVLGADLDKRSHVLSECVSDGQHLIRLGNFCQPWTRIAGTRERSSLFIFGMAL